MAKKDLSTGISLVKPGKVLIRGYDLIKLMDKISFGEMSYSSLQRDFQRKMRGR